MFPPEEGAETTESHSPQPQDIPLSLQRKVPPLSSGKHHSHTYSVDIHGEDLHFRVTENYGLVRKDSPGPVFGRPNVGPLPT